MPTIYARVTDEVIDIAPHTATVDSPAAGATVSFEGIIRNHDAGRGVTGIDYSSHRLAESILTKIATEASTFDGVHGVAVSHRVGHLDIGDRALVLAVSAEHRHQAFHACSYVVDQIKSRVPIWKHQAFTDGTKEWSNLP